MTKSPKPTAREKALRSRRQRARWKRITKVARHANLTRELVNRLWSGLRKSGLIKKALAGDRTTIRLIRARARRAVRN